MSFTAINFGKLGVLYASQHLRGAQACQFVYSAIARHKQSIVEDLDHEPRGYILMQVAPDHTSPSDPRPHYTVDAYALDAQGKDEPIGCLHVYTDKEGGLTAYPDARSGAMEAYNRVKASLAVSSTPASSTS